MSSTDFQTTNLGDINWTVSVIINFDYWVPPKLLMTLRISPPAHHCGHRPLWQKDTNFRRSGVWPIPKLPPNIRISRRISVRRISAEKNSASRIRLRIFAAVNPPEKNRISE